MRSPVRQRRRSLPTPLNRLANPPITVADAQSHGAALVNLPEETTRAVALKKGDVDIAYLLTGPIDLPDQWASKSPWHDLWVKK